MAEPSTLAERRRAIEISCLGLSGRLVNAAREFSERRELNLWHVKRATANDLSRIYYQLTELAIAAKGGTTLAPQIITPDPDDEDPEEAEQPEGAVDQAGANGNRKRGGRVRRDDRVQVRRKKNAHR
jgi:hypothetical protein